MYEDVRLDADIDFVDDLQADPAGDEPIDDALAALSTIHGTVRVEVPEGEYRLSADAHRLTAPGNGIRIIEAASGATPTIHVPAGHTGPWLSIEANGRLSGIDISRTAAACSPEIRVAPPTQFEIEHMTIDGHESLEAGEQGNGVLSVRSPASGTVRLRNVAIPQGTSTGTIGGAQPGVVVGPRSHGEVILENCHIANCSSHGVDAARAAGPVKVRGGRFENNNRSQIRLCGPGMEVAGAVVIVDLRGSPLALDEYSRTAGIWNEALTPRRRARPPSGGMIVDTTIAVQTGSVKKLLGAYYGTPLAGGMVVQGCDMIVDVGDVPAVSVTAPERVLDDHPPEEPLGITLTQSAFRGQARSGTAIEIEGRPASALTLSCIALPEEREGYDMPTGAQINGLNVHGRCTGPPRAR